VRASEVLRRYLEEEEFQLELQEEIEYDSLGELQEVPWKSGSL
jgi:hypothetical protein